MVHAGHCGPHRLPGLAQGDGQVHREVAHLVAQSDRLDAGLAAHGAGEGGHRVGDVEEPGVGADLFHGAPDADQHGHIAQGAVDPSRADAVAHRLGDAVGSRHVEVDGHGAEAAGGDAHDHEVGPRQRRPLIGGGGHGRLGLQRLDQLVGQRFHLRQGVGVDVVEHQVHAGQGRGSEEVGHQLGAPLVATAADDRHLGAHGVTILFSDMRVTLPAARARTRGVPPHDILGPVPGTLRQRERATSSCPRPPGGRLHHQWPGPPGAARDLCRPHAAAHSRPAPPGADLPERAGRADLCRRALAADALGGTGQCGRPRCGLPGECADGPRRRVGPESRAGGQSGGGLAPAAPTAPDGLGGAPGAARTRGGSQRSE